VRQIWISSPLRLEVVAQVLDCAQALVVLRRAASSGCSDR